jgi:hypothetical protein
MTCIVLSPVSAVITSRRLYRRVASLEKQKEINDVLLHFGVLITDFSFYLSGDIDEKTLKNTKNFIHHSLQKIPINFQNYLFQTEQIRIALRSSLEQQQKE